MKIHARKSVNVPSSFAVDQVRGMFDLKAEAVAKVEFAVELPDVDEDWQIGVIVGPSGSGKSTVAREAYGDSFFVGMPWDDSQAVVSQFGDESIKDVTQMLTAVGFSSPPSWIKPHHILSGGERFRCDLARALMMPHSLIAFDEFTSVVDRTVAKVCSAAVAKSIRRGTIKKKFVAVTCHYDVTDWLEADWVLDMASGQLARGRLRRPEISLTVATVHRGAWNLFKRHHYLNTKIGLSAKCFVAFWNEEPVAFSAWVPRVTKTNKGAMREHRTVVLPDYQGIGIGNRLSEFCASLFRGVGKKVYSTTSHPSMIHYRNQSPKWRACRFGRAAKPSKKASIKKGLSTARITGGFQFIGPPAERKLARQMIDSLRVVRPIGETIERIWNVLGSPGSSMISARTIVQRSGLPREKVDAILGQLERNQQIVRFRVGKKVVFGRV